MEYKTNEIPIHKIIILINHGNFGGGKEEIIPTVKNNTPARKV